MLIKFTYKEIKYMFIASLVMGFIFGLNDGKDFFVLSNWLINLIWMIILSFILLVVHHFGHKLVARRYGCTTKGNIWTMKRYGFESKAKLPITLFKGTIDIPFFSKLKKVPVGAVLGILIALFTKGRFYFPLIEKFDIHYKRRYQAGKPYDRLKNYDMGLISLGGLFANLVLISILAAINLELFSKFIVMNISFIAVHMIPFSDLDGAKIYFASRPLYVFSLWFMASYILIMLYMGVFAALFLSLIISFLIFLRYMYKRL